MVARLPAWLPHRVHNWWDARRTERHLSALRNTAPLPSADPARARAELFVLLCRRDLWIGILAIKSLLRYTEGRLAMTLIDDGSVDLGGRALVNTHLPGCRWLQASVPPAESADPLRGRPQLRELVRSGYVPYPKLIFPRAFARADRVILLDADTVFFAKPSTLTEWMSATSANALYLHDHRRDDRNEAPAEVKKRFAEFRDVVATGRPWSLPHFYFNSGLLAFEPRQLDFDVAEAFLDWNRSTPPALKSGRAGIWFGPWTPEQTAYFVMYAAMDPPPRPFGREYRLEDPTNSIFCHFLRAGLRRKDTMRRLQRVVGELP